MFDTYEWGELTELTLDNAIKYHDAKFRRILHQQKRAFSYNYGNYYDDGPLHDVDNTVNVNRITSRNGDKNVAIATSYDIRERFKHGMFTINVAGMRDDTIPRYLGKNMVNLLLRERSVLVFHNRRQGDYVWQKHFHTELIRAVAEDNHIHPTDIKGRIGGIHQSIRLFDDDRQYNNLRGRDRNIKLIILDNCKFISDVSEFRFLQFLFNNPEALIVSITEDISKYVPQTSRMAQGEATLEDVITRNFFRNSTPENDELWTNDMEEEFYAENY